MEIPGSEYHFAVGNYKCLVINDGTLAVPGATRTMSLRCLLVKIGKHTILIDTGMGAEGQPAAGKLSHNLQIEGINRADIDIVILSHGHGDHIGGTTDSAGSPLWPNARYYLSRQEWEFWTADPTLAHLHLEEDVRRLFQANVQKHLLAIKDRVMLIDSDKGILSGLDILPAPGHTPGNIVVALSAGTQKLLYLGDVVHDVQQLGQPEAIDVFDYDHEQACRTRMRFLSQLITPDVLVFAAHFPFPGLGHILPAGNVWRWQPIINA